MRTSNTALSVGLFTILLSAAAPAHAQDNSASVEALFDAGKKLVAAGKVAEACPKFLASYNLEHRVGTLLNLADCYERNGQFASGWARFVEATTLAQRANQAERIAFASQHAKALEGKLSTLVVAVPSPSPGMTVTRDGIAVDAAAYGVAVPVDGGAHVVNASAPGMRAWSGTVSVQATNDKQTLTIPALVAEPKVVATVPVEDTGSTRRYAGLATAGVGLVAVGVGTFFGVSALSKNHDSLAYCGIGGANNCTQPGVDLRSTAVTDGTLSTVFIGVGAAAIVGGAVLWLTGRASEPSTTVGFDGRSLQVAGRF